MHGCQIGTQCPILHASQDQLHPIGFSDDTVLAPAQFEECLKRELDAARAARDAFVADFGEPDYDAVVGGWGDKLRRVAAGEQRWGLFTATKH
jgi:hypothetical protein